METFFVALCVMAKMRFGHNQTVHQEGKGEINAGLPLGGGDPEQPSQRGCSLGTNAGRAPGPCPEKESVGQQSVPGPTTAFLVLYVLFFVCFLFCFSFFVVLVLYVLKRRKY